MILQQKTRPANYWLIFGIPAFLILLTCSLTLIDGPESKSPSFAFALVADLLLTVPLVYFLLIRKTKIPYTTVVPMMVLGLLIGTQVLPAESQTYLNSFKSYFLPVIELTVLSFIFIKVRKVRRAVRETQYAHSDFFTSVKEACTGIVPPKMVYPIAMEVAIIYYGIWTWRKKPVSKNEFTYHKKSGLVALLCALIMVVAVETVVLHILLEDVSNVLAWIITALSIYTGLQLLGMVKSMPRRYMQIQEDGVFLPQGVMGEAFIPYDQIESLEFSWQDFEDTDDLRRLSPLGGMARHNVILHCHVPQTIHGLYGIKKTAKSLALFVDDKQAFKAAIDQRIA